MRIFPFYMKILLPMTSCFVQMQTRTVHFTSFVFTCPHEGVCDLYIEVLLIKEGVANGGLRFPGTGCLGQGFGFIYLVLND